jgi:pimeloyl-ACP methyl ester carboxylesterase
MRIVLWTGMAIVLAFIAGAALESLVEARDLRQFPPPGQLIAVDGARRLHLRCQGSGPVTVVLEASGLGNSTSYDRVMSLVGAGARLCAYDRAGMGWSDPPSRSPDAASAASDLWVLLDRAGISPPYLLVAASAGGLGAELLARQHPEAIRGLIFLDALDGNAIDALQAPLAELRRDVCVASWLAKIGLLRLRDPLKLRGRTAALTYRASATDAACGLMRTISRSRDELAGTELAPLRSDLPIVVLSHGEPRGLFPPGHEAEARSMEPRWAELQDALARRSSRGTHRVVPGSGHLIAVDRPEAVADAILELLR